MTEKAQALRQQLIRNFDQTPRERYLRPPRYDTMIAALSDGTAAQKLGCGIDTVAPGQQSCPYHFHHTQEEMFIVLEGTGTLRVADELLPIQAGDVIFIPCGPDYPHHILNSSDAPLKYLSISTMERPEVCEYPDSGKIGVSTHRGERFMQRRANTLDYWDGEV
jgi:uncharacterized cupin superfamily protein